VRHEIPGMEFLCEPLRLRDFASESASSNSRRVRIFDALALPTLEGLATRW
jgi:hypothetical protein